MARLGFAIDNRVCIGCHACTVACKSEQSVPIGVNRTWVKYIEKGTFPDAHRSFSVQRCNHCENAPCVTICPVTSLYQRPDGIVDFNADRCIGCKACMQACPYDAIYIDPATHTAAKCNYCTHRVDRGYEPACVVVCPVEAIVSGDLDDPGSRISRLDRGEPVQYPKVEKGTKPKLFYVGGETAAMDPAQAGPSGDYLWGGTTTGLPAGALEDARREAEDGAARARRVYDVKPKGTPWGWMVSAYITTKAISAGVVVVAFLSFWLGGARQVLPPAAAAISLGFLALTGVLLVGDLKKPTRFLYVLLRPQWRSWLVRGAYLIFVFSVLVPVVAWVSATDASRATQLVFGAVVSVASVWVAVYTAFLLAQAKGRDHWQNPLLSVVFLADALAAGTATLTILGRLGFSGGLNEATARGWLCASVGMLAALLVAELGITHHSKGAHAAARMVLKGVYRRDFWGGVVLLGLLFPAGLVVFGGSYVLAALLVLFGISIKSHLLIQAPQQIPLS